MDTNHLQKAIIRLMEKETEKFIEEEAEQAAERVRTRVRAKVGQIATTVATWASFERFGNELRITVRIPSDDPDKIWSKESL